MREEEPRRVLVEQTSKKLKKEHLLWGCLLLVGLGLLLCGIWKAGLVAMAVGAVGCGAVKQKIWWDHG